MLAFFRTVITYVDIFDEKTQNLISRNLEMFLENLELVLGEQFDEMSISP